MDDLVSPSVFWSRYMSERLKESGHKVEVDLVCGGHIMEPPYFPHHDKVYAKYQGYFLLLTSSNTVMNGRKQFTTLSCFDCLHETHCFHEKKSRNSYVPE
ncbi:hypothetical protein Y032_0123g1130 [Ancylostoma ceylanicum]|nr:hypothetical protein Y032_0123g1130 [Ancylostoma ceylanicum]